MSSLAAHIHAVTMTALDACTERQRRAYMLVHGIGTEGVHAPPCGVTEAARMLGVPHARISEDLTRARATVYEHIAKSLIIRLTEYEDGQQIPAPDHGHTNAVYRDGYYVIDRSGRHPLGTAYTEETFTLGAGSEALTKAAKHSTTTRGDALTRAHQTYTKRSQP